MSVSAPNGVPDDDAFWQRPAPDSDSSPPAPPAAAGKPAPDYPGPPRTDPPPAQWRPPLISQPPPPRSLPAQDMDALDENERSARTVTLGVGMVAGAIAVILMCLLCARAIF